MGPSTHRAAQPASAPRSSEASTPKSNEASQLSLSGVAVPLTAAPATISAGDQTKSAREPVPGHAAPSIPATVDLVKDMTSVTDASASNQHSNGVILISNERASFQVSAAVRPAARESSRGLRRGTHALPGEKHVNWAGSVKGMPPPGGARKEELSSSQEQLALPQTLEKSPKAVDPPGLKGLDALLAVADDVAASKSEGSSASDEDAARNGRAEQLEHAAPQPPSRSLAAPALTSEVLAHTPTTGAHSLMDGVVASQRPHVKSCRQAMEVAQRAVFVYHQLRNHNEVQEAMRDV